MAAPLPSTAVPKRADLLALTPDDLVLVANRGIVRRAQAEVESGDPTWELTEDERGDVTVRWSDGVTCLLPAEKTLAQGRCSCPATTLCRHLIRTVLVYQRTVQQFAPPSPPDQGTPAKAASGEAGSIAPGAAPHGAPAAPRAGSPPAPSRWDPGAIADDTLARVVPRSALARARRLYDEGQVLDVTRTAKPLAHAHTLSCTVRFLVPGDPRYAHCDCAEEAPCSHVPLAVWAFRQLPPEQTAGVVSTRREPLPMPTAVLDDVEVALRSLVETGISGAPAVFLDRLRRLEGRCRADGLLWPADILAELVAQCEAYAGHDARFEPEQVAGLAGELCARLDAIRADTGAAPQLFIRGSEPDRTTAAGTSRLIGLGCGVRRHRRSVEVLAFLQDSDSGHALVVRRDFADPEPDGGEAPRHYSRLAQTAVARGASLAALGRGQLLVKGGRRLPSGEFVPGRAQLTYNLQTYAWESLREPVRAQSGAEVAARLAALPPPALRPRRVAEDLCVLPVARVEDVAFAPAEQEVRAAFWDLEGGTAALVLPYVTLAAEGVEAALALLRRQPETIRFVAGRVRLAHGRLVVEPVALVYEDGGRRAMLQPWVDRLSEPASRIGLAAGGSPADLGPGAAPAAASGAGQDAPSDPLTGYFQDLHRELSEILLVGLQRAGAPIAGSWARLHQRGQALGFHRMTSPVECLATTLEQKVHSLQWDHAPAAAAALDLAALLQIAQAELAA